MKRISVQFLTFVLLVVVVGHAVAEVKTGPLADYVAKEDTSYAWAKRREGDVSGVKFAELILTSQTWRGITWKHQLFVLRPEEVEEPARGLLLISGGDWKSELEGPADAARDKQPPEAAILASTVKRLKSPVAILSHVPHQPIFDGKVEDQIIAYTFVEYLKSRDPEWPLLLPMTKSAVRAMDAVQEFGKKEWNLDIASFTVTGGSKRGWTTWLVGAVDPRADAIAPIVIDVLNMPVQMKHQLATWGKYSEMIDDYTKLGIQLYDETEEGKALNAIVDPYSYRHDLSQPKLIVMGTNDRYWPLDALNIYWNDLSGEKYILYIPNNGHGVNDVARLTGSIGALHRKAAGRLQLPKLTWDMAEANGRLRLAVRSDIAPKEVAAWTSAASTRDFRDVKWTSQPAELVDGAHRYELPVPEQGFAAMFGEAVYEQDGLKYYLSTNVKIVGSKQAATVNAN